MQEIVELIHATIMNNRKNVITAYCSVKCAIVEISS